MDNREANRYSHPLTCTCVDCVAERTGITPEQRQLLRQRHPVEAQTEAPVSESLKVIERNLKRGETTWYRVKRALRSWWAS